MSAGTRVDAGQSVIELDRHAVYLSPTGRRCRWWPSLADRALGDRAFFVYDLEDGRRASSALSDGFVLMKANWHLLRRVS